MKKYKKISKIEVLPFSVPITDEMRALGVVPLREVYGEKTNIYTACGMPPEDHGHIPGYVLCPGNLIVRENGKIFRMTAKEFEKLGYREVKSRKAK